jgi:UDP-N-acetylglucosamine--N-acetylmuramyl-(pentapeptide) pyrophosphoryl-undecaprenol N-acetylglucosamine transferase
VSTLKPYRIILSGGGTGGHIYPAIAIANALKSKNPETEFLFVGAKDRMEMEKVPQAGYAIEGLWISGLQRQLTLKNGMFPLKVFSSLIKSRKIIRRFKPDIVLGTGGFASGPLLYAAAAKGIPTLIQEQNSYPGITNKLLSKKAKRICVAYEGLERFFPKDKIVITGNPVREDLLDVSQKRLRANTYFKLNPKKQTLLVLGGSLGARRINELIAEKCSFLEAKNIQVIWQCGKLYYEKYKDLEQHKHIQVHAFLNAMDLAYAAADIIISRAGASSVSELCIVGKPVLFIPSPNVAEDHQTKNAKAIVSKKAAILIKENNLKADFEPVFSELIASKEKQKTLSENIKTLALVNATKAIVKEVEQVLNA